MFFRNLRPYSLKNFGMSPGGLESYLDKHPLVSATGLSIQSVGWVPPVEGGGLVYWQGRNYLIALGVEKRTIPPSTIKKELKARAADLETQQGYKPGKKQLRDLTERIVTELLPRAFAKLTVTRAWLDLDASLIVIDAATTATAETLLEQLRNALGELPVYRTETECSVQGAMTAWLTVGDTPGQFALDSDCQLRGTGEEAATVRYARHDLSVKEIREHISGGKFATHLGLLWKDRVSLLLTEPLYVGKVKFLATEAGGDEGTGLSAADQLDADFTLFTGEMRALLKDLFAALGGVKHEAMPAAAASPAPAPPATTEKSPPPFSGDDGEDDPMYPQAVQVVLADQKASVSLVQRKLVIGYNRAARLVERMEVEGIVGHSGPGGERAVLKTKLEG